MIERYQLPDLTSDRRHRFRLLEWVVTLIAVFTLLGCLGFYGIPEDELNPTYIELPLTDAAPQCPPEYPSEPVIRNDETFRCYVMGSK